MKKLTLFMMVIALLAIAGCKDSKKELYLPEAKNDKIYTTIGEDDKYQTEFCLISPKTIIELNLDIKKLNMQPVSVEYGSGDGFKWTENKYEDVLIKALISDNNKEIINRITTTSSNYETVRGIKVGDSVSKLTNTYKDNLEYSESTEKSYYIYDPENDIGFKRIFFYVDNDIINEIVIEDGIDG